MIDTIDLKAFCAVDPMIRDHLKQPWTEGGYTYASDGRVLIRVASSGAPTTHEHPNISMMPLPVVRDLDPPLSLANIVLPEKTEANCEECNEYASPQPGCPECAGTGSVMRYPLGMDVRGVRLARHYIELLKTLPDCRFVSLPTNLTAVSFVFDGGEGLLMCMRPIRPGEVA